VPDLPENPDCLLTLSPFSGAPCYASVKHEFVAKSYPFP